MVKCNKCSKKFTDQRYLDQHLKKKIACDKHLICPKCFEKFSTQQNLNSHLSRKVSCIVDEVPIIEHGNKENRCKFCNKLYTTRSNLLRHQKKCDIDKNSGSIMALLLKNEEQNKEILRRLDEQAKNSSNHINIIDNRKTVYFNINMVKFGNENLDKIDSKQVSDIIIHDHDNYVPQMIKIIHCNPDLPEFHNIYYDPINETIMIYDEAPDRNNTLTWQLRDIEEISLLLAQQAHKYYKSYPLIQNVPKGSLAEKKFLENFEKVGNSKNAELWTTPESIEKNKKVLTTLAKNSNFRKEIMFIDN